VVPIVLESEQYEKLRELARSRRLSVSAYIRQLVLQSRDSRKALLDGTFYFNPATDEGCNQEIVERTT